MNAISSKQIHTTAIQQSSTDANTSATKVTAAMASSASPSLGSSSQLTSEQAIAQWSEQIRLCFAYSVGWVILAGTKLLEAKARWSPADFQRLFCRGHVAFGRRMGQVLMRLAKHETMRDFKFLASLPQSITALNELASVDSRIVEQGIESREVNPHMTAQQAKQFARKHRGQGANDSIAVNRMQTAANR